MRTDALIRVLAADAAPRAGVGRVLAATLVGIGAGVALVALTVLGVNPDLGSMLRGPLLLLRQVFPMLLVLGAGLGALCLARPDGRPGLARLLLAAAAVVGGAVVLRELTRLPPGAWGGAALGETGIACLASVSAMALPLLLGALWALARGATTRPRASGALAGLLAGAIAASIYALHCTEASPLFYAAWYVPALAGATGLGALLGARVLRW